MGLRPLAISAVAAAAAALLNSCATVAPVTPFAPDMTAKAPVLSGYGRVDFRITTKSPEAQALFNQAVLQAYAFNEAAAVRAFKAALAQDAGCAMCAWGVAWQLGPNINNVDRDNVPEAIKYIDYALKHLDGATPRERALVESLAVRYAHESTARETAPLMAERCALAKDDQPKIHPLDEAYADRMRKIVAQYPDDANVMSLYAEAEFIVAPDDQPWDKAGKPSGHLGEVADRIEQLLARNPDHTGLNHYMVHVLDAASVAPRALAAADRLGTLAPASPHLLHMPAHIYINVGRFEDASRVNDQAVAADVVLADAEKAQGFEPSKDWRRHDAHFLWYAAMTAGQEKDALDAADTIAQVTAKSDNNFGEYARSLHLIALLHFQRWNAVIESPKPAGEKGVAQAFWLYARGVANARTGHVEEATALLAQLVPVAAQVRERDAKRKRTVAMMDYTAAQLESEIALARGDMKAAIAAQSKAVDATANLDDTEPPMMGDVAQTMLGDMQSKAGLWADAEATYRKALADRPGHPLAQRGLREALAAQKKA